MSIIPADTPSAGRDHALASFSGDPVQAASIGPASDDWENVLNPMFHGAFGWSQEGGLYDFSNEFRALLRNAELCGLCLRVSPMCLIFLKKGKGSGALPSIDQKKSTCVNLVHFNYASAISSTDSSPCTNYPVVCPLCPAKAPTVWTYNLATHYVLRHKIASHDNHPLTHFVAHSESDKIKGIWDSQLKPKATRQSTKTVKAPLMISEAHSSR
ncbi:hypothetical protein H0H87_008801, partial [Tephrocybe sp. NHM501043]